MKESAIPDVLFTSHSANNNSMERLHELAERKKARTSRGPSDTQRKKERRKNRIKYPFANERTEGPQMALRVEYLVKKAV